MMSNLNIVYNIYRDICNCLMIQVQKTSNFFKKKTENFEKKNIPFFAGGLSDFGSTNFCDLKMS